MAAAHYDALESRDPAARERELFTRLPEAIARAMTAAGWARQLKGVEPKSIGSRAALAKLPLLRKSDLLSLQKDSPPFGGFNVTPPGKAKRLHMSPGPIFEPEGSAPTSAGRRARRSPRVSVQATSCTIRIPII